jgi:hypothetical protein
MIQDFLKDGGMNQNSIISNSSSYVGFFNSTNTGGNNIYYMKHPSVYFFINNNMVIPNDVTARSIMEAEHITELRFNAAADLLNFLNQ